MNRHPLRLTIAGIDTPRQLIEFLFEVGVIGDQGAAGDDNLHQRDAPDQFGVFFQGPFKGQKPLGNALGIIKPINAQHQLAAAQVFVQIPGRIFDLVRARPFIEFAEIDTDGVMSDLDESLAEFQQRVVSFPAYDLKLRHQHAGGLYKITAIPEGLKADLIVSQQSSDQFGFPWQPPIQVRRGKRNVQEKGQLIPHSQLPQMRSDQHQLVIVDPYEIIGSGICGDNCGEFLVDRLISLPLGQIKTTETEQVVKQRPDGRVGKAAIIALHFIFTERHRNQLITLLFFKLMQQAFQGGIRIATGPADPDAVIFAHHRCQGGDQTACAGFHGPLVPGLPNHRW